jgi:hypothetical protein
MSWVAVAAGGAAVVGGIMGGNAAKDAAASQEAAARLTAESNERIYNQQREDQKPWMEAGGRALTKMEDPSFQKNFTMADFSADPGYAFRMAEAEKAMSRSAAAKGNLMGGNFAKELTRYSQGAASEEYGKAYDRFNNDSTMRFNRLGALAGVGQTATNAVGQAGSNFAAGQANAYGAIGNAQAGGAMGSANAIAGGVGQAANIGMSSWMMNQMKKPTNPWAGGTSAGGSGTNYGGYA